ncbi:unnamed protein product [Discula destructiva]
MDSYLLDRELGNLTHSDLSRQVTTKLLRTFQPAPQHRFDGGHKGSATSGNGEGASNTGRVNQYERVDLWAHQAGVQALALERFDGKILISGGADATIKLWDLEQCGNPNYPHTYKPLGTINRSEGGTHAHKFGITQLSFFPIDPDAFLSSSYDQTLKLWATQGAQLSGSWNLGSKMYTHAISPIADHLLVACGLAHPAVRLVDLRSNAAVKTLVAPGQVSSGGAVLSLAWSPRHEHILASGTLDGAVRIWDIRRASSLVGLLDQEDSVGIFARRGEANPHGARDPWTRGYRLSAKAHAGPVNGLTWSDDGAYIVSAGHDRRIRVWDAATGANTLASFGPSIRNGQLANVPMFVSPSGLTPPKKELLFWPNESELLVMELHEGTVVTRLRAPGSPFAGVRTNRAGERSVLNRITSLVWRGSGGYGGNGSIGPVPGGTAASGAIYSGQTDGQIRAWMPEVLEDDGETELDEDDKDQEGRKRKRTAIDDAVRSMSGKNITFTDAR